MIRGGARCTLTQSWSAQNAWRQRAVLLRLQSTGMSRCATGGSVAADRKQGRKNDEDPGAQARVPATRWMNLFGELIQSQLTIGLNFRPMIR